MITTNLKNYFKSQSYDVVRVLNEFKKSIHTNKFFINKRGLLDSAKHVEFVAKWERNPLQFCNDYYNEQYLYPIILLCNNIGSMYDFTSDNLHNIIISPDTKKIISIISG